MTAHLPKVFQPRTLALSVFAALYPLASPVVMAATENSCTIGSNGQWQCVQRERQSSVARPQQQAAAPAQQSKKQRKAKKAPRTNAERQMAQNSQPVQPSMVEAGQRLPATAVDNPYAYLDWIPREQLTEAQLAEIGPYCSGAFFEPKREGKHDNTPFDEAPVFASAEDSLYDHNAQTTLLSGAVLLRQSNLQFSSDQASLNQETRVASLDGNVRLRDDDMLILGDHAQLQLDNGEAQIENIQYVIHNMQSRGAAEYINRTEDGIVRLKSGSFTSCSPGNSDWHLHSNNIKLNPETGFGTATNATLRVRNIPVLYTPYIYFPIDDRRQSGFLPPRISYSSKHGINLTTPYYINLAPHMDATLYPNYTTRRGLLNEAEFRYLTKKSEGQVGVAFLGDDKEDKRKLMTGYKKDRWMFNFQHEHGFSERLLAEIDYTDVSDPYYFMDLSSNIISSSDTTLDQRAGLTWRGDSFTAGLKVHDYERVNISDLTPYSKLPQFTLDGKLPMQPGGLQFAYKSEITRFDRSLKNGIVTLEDGTYKNWRDATLKGLNRANGTRMHVEPAVSLPMNWSWGFVKPSLKYAYTRYDLDLDSRGKETLLASQKFSKSPNRSVPIYSVDSGLYFDRPTTLFGNSYTQTLEPRLYYLYVPYENQDNIPLFDTSETSFSYAGLFRDNRFSGRDRIGDANQFSLGLTWRWLQDSGVERQRLSVGQAYYLADRKVLLSAKSKDEYKDSRFNTGNRSPYAMEYAYRFNDDWRVTADWAWDPEVHSTRTGSIMFNYQPADDLNKIINLGYRYKNDGVYYNEDEGRYVIGNRDYVYRDPVTGEKKVYKDFYKIEQTDASIIWPIAARWNAIARWQYDYNRNRTLDAFGGFEYNSCCWKVRLIQRYWLHYDENDISPENNRSPDRGVFLQIVLKGLGGVTGKKVSSFLDEGIPGYQRREENGY